MAKSVKNRVAAMVALVKRGLVKSVMVKRVLGLTLVDGLLVRPAMDQRCVSSSTSKA